MALIFPQKSSIDAWAKLGNEGWDWATLGPYYSKFYTYNRPSSGLEKALATNYIREEVQGKSGPIQASFPEYYGKFSELWPGTFKNLDMVMSNDPVSGEGVGGFTSLSAIDPRTSQRSFSGSAYYKTVADRPNLHVITEATVEKIVFEDTENAPKATGVRFRQKDTSQVQTINASKEIVLCAGAFGSPRLLELSGIGSSKLLQKHDIEVVLDNPSVGENLQDHCMTGVSFEVVDGFPTLDSFRDPAVLGAAIESYKTAGNGPLSTTWNCIASYPVMEFMSEKGRQELTSVLDKHLQSTSPTSGSPTEASQHAALRTILENPDDGTILVAAGPLQMHVDRTKQTEIFGILDPENYISLIAYLTNPFSRAAGHIASASISDPPAIDPNYVSHPLDQEILARHTRYLLTIAETKPLADIIKPNGKRLPENSDLSTVEAAREFVRRNLVSNWHSSGTCAMLPWEKGGVVDVGLRVHGARGLRVVDASVFPMIPKGNVQSSVYAVAERAADLIRGEWGFRVVESGKGL